MSTAGQALAEEILGSIAHNMQVQANELGQQWVEFATAVAEVATTAVVDDCRALGRLVIAAVRLP